MRYNFLISDQYFNPNTSINQRNVSILNSSNYSNSLGHVIRNNTISSNLFIEGNENLSTSPILNNLNQASGPLYTGL